MSGWDTVESTGLADDIDGTVLPSSHFGYDATYGDNLVFILELEVDGESEPARQFYSLGKNWETNDHGETVVRTGGKSSDFERGSNYGILIEAVKALPDAFKVLASRGTPDHAEVWHGLKFHWNREKIVRKFKDGEERESRVLVPTAFMGEGGTQAGSTLDLSSFDKARVAKLKALAKKADSHDDFIIAVMESMPDLETEDEELYQSVLDSKGVYASV